MDTRFDTIAARPENSIFKVVFFPDRVYHALALSAARSDRYRYSVQEVRNALDICVMKGEVFLDGVFASNVLRIEYTAERLIEQVREKGRFLGDRVLAWVKLLPDDQTLGAEGYLHLIYDPRIGAYQAEVWDTLEPPAGQRHDFRILDIIGDGNWISCIPGFSGAIGQLSGLNRLDVAFRENELDLPRGYGQGGSSSGNWSNLLLAAGQRAGHRDPSSQPCLPSR